MRSVRMPVNATPAEIVAVMCQENAPAYTDGYVVEVTTCRPEGFHMLALDKSECWLMFGGCPKRAAHH